MITERALRPLDDILVLDLSRILSGPFATMQLADFGARVIKVEEPGQGDGTREYGPPFVAGESTYYLSINRGKESVALDLKADAGRALCRRLASRADVVVENFRPGVAERLGLGHAALAAENPRLVYVSISGYGHAGLPEWSARPGFDLVIQGTSGLQWLTGPADGAPHKVGTSITDLLAGLYAVQGTLLGLRARERTGRGQKVDVSMLEGAVSVLTFHAQSQLAGTPAQRMGNLHPNIAPYEPFATRDGYVNIACGTDRTFRQLCGALGRAELAEDPRFRSNRERVAHRDVLHDALEASTRREGRDALCARLDEAGVPCGPILDVAAAVAHPQHEARGFLATLEHPRCGTLRQPGVAVRLEGTPGRTGRPPPLLGEHTDEVLREVLGLDNAELSALRAAGVTAAAEK